MFYGQKKTMLLGIMRRLRESRSRMESDGGDGVSKSRRELPTGMEQLGNETKRNDSVEFRIRVVVGSSY